MSKGTKLIVYLLAAVVVLIIVVVVGKKQGWIGSGSAVKVSTEKAELRTIVETVSANGRIFPELEVKISSDVSGEIIELPVKEGDSVKTGTLLAVINPDIYQSLAERAAATLNNAKANLANARAREAQVGAQFLQVKASYDRNKKLYDQGVISIADFENAEASFKTTEAELEAAKQTVNGAEFSVRSAEAGLKEARDNLARTTIYSPMVGIVSKLNVEKGERVVGTMQMLGTEMMIIANMNNMEVQVDVSENNILKVDLGDTAIVEVDAYLDKKFKGVVTEVGNSANSGNMLTSDQVTNFTVKIRLVHESYKNVLKDKGSNKFPFRPGMSATAEIRTKTMDNVLTVPLKAVTTRKEEDSTDAKAVDERKVLVFVREELGEKVKAVEVETGIQDDTYIHITKGIEEGTEVVSGPYSAVSRRLKDGDRIQIVEEDELFSKE